MRDLLVREWAYVHACVHACKGVRETGGPRESPLMDLMSKNRCQEILTCECVCSRNSIPVARVHLGPWCLHVQEAPAGGMGTQGREQDRLCLSPAAGRIHLAFLCTYMYSH